MKNNTNKNQVSIRILANFQRVLDNDLTKSERYVSQGSNNIRLIATALATNEEYTQDYWKNFDYRGLNENYYLVRFISLHDYEKLKKTIHPSFNTLQHKNKWERSDIDLLQEGSGDNYLLYPKSDNFVILYTTLEHFLMANLLRVEPLGKNYLLFNLIFGMPNSKNIKDKEAVYRNTLFEFTGITWNNIVLLFKLYNIDISGGTITKRHTVTSQQFDFISYISRLYSDKYELDKVLYFSYSNSKLLLSTKGIKITHIHLKNVIGQIKNTPLNELWLFTSQEYRGSISTVFKILELDKLGLNDLTSKDEYYRLGSFILDNLHFNLTILIKYIIERLTLVSKEYKKTGADGAAVTEEEKLSCCLAEKNNDNKEYIGGVESHKNYENTITDGIKTLEALIKKYSDMLNEINNRKTVNSSDTINDIEKIYEKELIEQKKDLDDYKKDNNVSKEFQYKLGEQNLKEIYPDVPVNNLRLIKKNKYISKNNKYRRNVREYSTSTA